MSLRFNIEGELEDLVKSYAKDMRLLLVDDNLSDIEFYKVMFGNYFAECDIAKNGKEAFNKFIEKGAGYYDLIVTDIEMPKLNGLELIRMIRNNSLKQSIVVLTSVEDIKTNQNISFYYIDGILPKPVDKQKLFVLLYRVLKRISNEKDYENYVNKLEDDIINVEKVIRNLNIAIDILSRVKNVDRINEVLYIMKGILESAEEFIEEREGLRLRRKSKEVDGEELLSFEESLVNNELKVLHAGGYLNAKDYSLIETIDKDLLDDILKIFEELEVVGGKIVGLNGDFVRLFELLIERYLEFLERSLEFKKLKESFERLLEYYGNIKKNPQNYLMLRYQFNETIKMLKKFTISLFVEQSLENIHIYDLDIMENISQIRTLAEENGGW